MAKHLLSLEVPKVSNEKTLIIKDTSVYSDKIPVKNKELLILSPNSTSSRLISIGDNAETILNACSLEQQSADCEELEIILRDGIYVIRYSVSPNENIYVEYNQYESCNTNKKLLQRFMPRK